MKRDYYSLRVALNELIFNSWKKDQLMKNHKLWRQIGTSLYILSDTQNALESFRELKETSNQGLNYLVNFGILQILFLQQDAIRSIYDSLGLDFKLSEKLYKIREVRNDIAGHPTDRKHQSSSHFIIQSTLKTKQFSVADQYGNALPEYRYINTSKLVDDQQEEITYLLENAVTALENEWQNHKDKFRMTKLSDILHFNKFYKDLEEISRPLGNEPGYTYKYGKSSLETLQNRLENFKSELSKRGLLGNIDSIDHTLTMMEHPLNEVKNYYHDSMKSRLNKTDIKIFLEYVRFSLQELYDISSDIDDGYESDVTKS